MRPPVVPVRQILGVSDAILRNSDRQISKDKSEMRKG